MTKRYTAADFANARFAEHPDGDFAARLYPEHIDPWFGDDDCAYTDQVLADTGWVPMPTKPTLTESEYERVLSGVNDDYATGYIDAVNTFGIEIIPDPEPTNTDILAKLLGEVATDAGVNLNPRLFAEQLDNAGVTAPNVKGN